jgi:hypothetical protein
MGTNIEQLDISKLLEEAGAEVDALIKSEREKIEALQKKEESSKEKSSKEESSEKSSKEESSMHKKEISAKHKANGDVMKKEESSKEASSKEWSMKKDEGSGYESQAPEASSPAPEMSAGAPGQEGQHEDQGEDLQSMVSSLDDEMLHELMQVVQMEMEGRQQQHAGPEGAPHEEAGPEAAAPQEAPGMEKMAMAYKSELEATKDRLAKAEEQTANIQKSFLAMTELLDKMVNKPVQKAVTDIRSIDYVDKGEKDLKKAEETNISDADLQKKAKELSSDFKKLGSLTKNEREVLSDFFVNKKRTPEILKLVSK